MPGVSGLKTLRARLAMEQGAAFRLACRSRQQHIQQELNFLCGAPRNSPVRFPFALAVLEVEFSAQESGNVAFFDVTPVSAPYTPVPSFHSTLPRDEEIADW